MADDKAGLPPLAPGNRMPSLTGVVMVDTYRGQPRVRAWPRKRGHPKTEKHRQQVEWFTWAQAMAKGQPGRTHATAIDFTKGTGFYPRDLMTAALKGTAWNVSLSDGRRYTPLSNAQTVSENLDLIGHVPGSILLRGPSRWQAVPLADLNASWLPMHANPVIIATAAGGGQATKGNIYQGYAGSGILAVDIFTTTVVGGQYRAVAALLVGGGTVIETIAFGPTITATAVENIFLGGFCPIVIPPRRRLFVGLSRLNGGDAYALPRSLEANAAPTLWGLIGAAGIAKAIPAPGDALAAPVANNIVFGHVAAAPLL